MIFNYLKKFVFNPAIRFSYLSRLGFYNHMSDIDYVKKEWKVNFNSDLDLIEPKTFNEKL